MIPRLLKLPHLLAARRRQWSTRRVQHTALHCSSGILGDVVDGFALLHFGARGDSAGFVGDVGVSAGWHCVVRLVRVEGGGGGGDGMREDILNFFEEARQDSGIWLPPPPRLG